MQPVQRVQPQRIHVGEMSIGAALPTGAVTAIVPITVPSTIPLARDLTVPLAIPLVGELTIAFPGELPLETTLVLPGQGPLALALEPATELALLLPGPLSIACVVMSDVTPRIPQRAISTTVESTLDAVALAIEVLRQRVLAVGRRDHRE